MSSYENFEDFASGAMERDPRGAVGYLTGGSFVLDSSRVFCWFSDLSGLIEQLREIEPRVYQLEAGDLDRFQAALDPLLEQIRTEGLTERNRADLNSAVKDAFVVDWWGTFDSLVTGGSEFAREARLSFRDDDNEGPIRDEEVEDFVEFLREYRI